MISITRKIGQSLHIGDEVLIKVTKINRNYVSLGIEAPRHIRIERANSCQEIESLAGEKKDESTLDLLNSVGLV